MHKKGLYSIHQARLSKNHCFLCGIKLNKANRTDEHVFPKWLLRKFSLWNKNLFLLNKTPIKYRQLTIPCCNNCNNTYLSKLESKIDSALKKGVETFKKLSRKTIYFWLCKILYAILFKELFLYRNRKRMTRTKIIPKTFVWNAYQILHNFLQGIRKPLKYKYTKPFSIFVFKLQTHKNNDLNFDFIDSIITKSIALRLGNIGIIASLTEGGVIEQLYRGDFKKFHKIKLHPMQFNELFALVVYKVGQLQRQSSFGFIEGKKWIFVLCNPPYMGLSNKPVFRPWDIKEFAEILAHYQKCNIEDILPVSTPGLINSSLHNPDHSVRKMDTAALDGFS